MMMAAETQQPPPTQQQPGNNSNPANSGGNSAMNSNSSNQPPPGGKHGLPNGILENKEPNSKLLGGGPPNDDLAYRNHLNYNNTNSNSVGPPPPGGKNPNGDTNSNSVIPPNLDYPGHYPPPPPNAGSHYPPQHPSSMPPSHHHPQQQLLPQQQPPPHNFQHPQDPYYSQQNYQHRFPGKPLPGGGMQPIPPPQTGYPTMRGYPPVNQPPTGPTPTLNELLKSSNSANSNSTNSGPPPPNSSSNNANPQANYRYPYDQQGYPIPPQQQQHHQQPPPHHMKSDYPPPPGPLPPSANSWPPPPHQQQRPPPVNSYGHPQQQQQQQPLPPPQHHQQQQMYRQPGPRPGPPMPPQQGYYPPQQSTYPPGPPHSPHYPPPPQQQQQPPQSPLHSTAQRYPPPPGSRPGAESMNHSPSPQHYNIPPTGLPPDGGQQQQHSQSSYSSSTTNTSTSTASANINHSNSNSSGSDNVPPNSSNSNSSSSGPSGHHRPKSTPPPPQSPSLGQQQQHNLPNHHQPPQSPQQSPRTSSVGSIVTNSNSNSLQQHRPPPAGPGQPLQLHYPQQQQQQPPDVGDCNSNDGGGGGGMRSSPTGSAGSRSMSPAVGNNPNIPIPPRPSSSQSDGSGAHRQSPMPPGGQYLIQQQQQQPMAPPPHHMYPPGGKYPGQMIPPSGPGHYPPHPQQHWPNQPPPQGYPIQGRPPAQHPQHGMMTGYPTQPPQTGQPGMPQNPNYGPPHQSRQGPPPQSQYVNYQPPAPTYGGPVPQWALPQNSTHNSAAQNQNVRSQTPQQFVKHHLQQKLTGFPSPPHQGSYPMGPPSSTPPPPQYGGHLPPPSMPHPTSHHESMDTSNSTNNLIGPDGTPLDDASQHSTASGASGGDDGPKTKRDSSHPNYSNHPPTPQAAPSPGAGSLNSMHDEFGDGNSPGGGWPRTPASPVLNSHPPSSTDQFRSKVKKPDSMTKLYEMDNNPERRIFLDKLLHYMDEHGTPITACPTISKQPLDLFKMYYSVKERGGFLEVSKVTKNKAWKDVAAILGIGASSSAAYTLRKHYTKHLLPYECKFDRGGIDPLPLINQVESSTKKKGAGKAAPVPSPGSSNSQDSFQGGQASTPVPNNSGSTGNSTPNSSMDGFPSSYPPQGPYGSQQAPQTQGPPQQQPMPPTSMPSEYPASSPSVVGPPPSQRGAAPSTPQHPGDKVISVSNPFDDMSLPMPALNHPYQQTFFQQGSRAIYNPAAYSSPLPLSGYQGPPPGNYSPYSVPPGDQFSRGPATQPHEYPQQHPSSMPPSHHHPQQQFIAQQQPPPHHIQHPQDPYYSQQNYQHRFPGKPSPGSGIPPPQTGYPPVRGYPPVNQSPAVPPQNEPLKPSNTYPSSSSAGPLPPTSTSNAVPQATYRYPYDQAYGPGPGVPPPQQQQHHPQHLKSEYPTTPSQLSPSAAGSWPPTSHQQQQRPQGPGPVPQGQSWPGSPQQRMAARPAFPSVKPEIYKGYSSPGPMIPSSSAPLPHAQNSKPLNSMLSSPLTPINQMASSAMALSNSAIHCVPQPTPFSQTALAAPPMPIKKEIVFPPDSVEAVSPVLTRRRKLHKNDVAPVEPWRIVMCLKSGLLAETTWAIDVLNVLLYDDHSISYFSLSYLPGLLDLILEHFRRSLVLTFGQSVGLEIGTEKDDNTKSKAKRRKWYEISSNIDEEEKQQSIDIGTPLLKFPKNCVRTVVLNGTNYTLKTRITDKEVGFESKDDEPFIVSGPRDWDIDEKLRIDPNFQIDNVTSNAMEVTRHVVTNFTSDLNIVPLIRVLKTNTKAGSLTAEEENGGGKESNVIVKSEPKELNDTFMLNGEVTNPAVNLDLYTCEVKVAPEMPSKTSTKKSSNRKQSNIPSSTAPPPNPPVAAIVPPKNDDSSSAQNALSFLVDNNGNSNNNNSSSVMKADIVNCQNALATAFKGKLSRANNKGKKSLDSIVNRIKSKDPLKQEQDTDNPLNLVLNSVKTKSDEVLANSCSDNAVTMDQTTGKVEENSTTNVNHQMPQPPSTVVTTNHNSSENSSSETCDNSTKSNPITNNSSIEKDMTQEIKIEPQEPNSKEDSKTTSEESTPFPAPQPPTIPIVADVEGEGTSESISSINSEGVRLRTYGSSVKRRRLEEYEDECYTRDEASSYNVTETQDSLARRMLALCNILRNLTFVPGNDVEIGKNPQFLSLLGKLILLHHDHPLKGKSKAATATDSAPTTTAVVGVSETQQNQRLNSTEKDDSTSAVAITSSTPTPTSDVVVPVPDEIGGGGNGLDDDGLFNLGSISSSTGGVPIISNDLDNESCTSLNNTDEWWWEYLHHIREHVLVIIANISGQVDLSLYSEEISRPILDGLLHWAICPAAYGQDPFPISTSSILTPQRLAIEALCKLCVTQGNVDLLLATPPYSRIEKLCQLLSRWLCRSEDQVLREFAVNLLSYLSGADSGIARTIAKQNPCISLLISFIEQAEQNAMNIANNHGFAILRENPDAMGTSLDMLRRAANTLLNLAKHPDNRALFVHHEPRLLNLVMSQILEQKVAAIVAQVLFQCSSDTISGGGGMSSGGGINDFYTPAMSRSRNIPNNY